MLVFWISASGMIAVALAFVLPALVSRRAGTGPSRAAANLAIYRERRRELEAEHDSGRVDAEQLEAALREMDRELLRDAQDDGGQHDAPATRNPYPAIAIAVLLPVVAFGGYLKLGSPELLMRGSTAAGPASDASGPAQAQDAPHSVQEMVARLEQRMRENPEDPEGWLMLGRSYAAMGQLQTALDALQQADRRRPDHPFTLVAQAEVLAALQGDSLDGQPIALVERTLEIEPDFPRGLWLAGVHAFNSGDRERARELWQRLVAVPGLSPDALAQINEAIAQTGGAREPARATATSGDVSITASVQLSPSLTSRLNGSETLFVFAQAQGGPPMPLAVVRRAASELPLTVTLDESMAMTPQMTLSSFDQVVVSARISRSGSATPSSGDLQGRSAAVSPASRPAVNVIIDQVVE